MAHDPKQEQAQHEILSSDRLDDDRRRQLTEAKVQLAQVIQQHNMDPEVALTAMLNIVGSIIATQFTVEESTAWTEKFITSLALYVRIYATGERRPLI